jgi:hypothetical protein
METQATVFRQRAVECERLAEVSFRPHDREVMLYAAERWRELADEEEARTTRESGPSTGVNLP